jgi:TolA protein
MRGPHLQKTSILSFTILSIALHLTVFAMALIILKQTNQVSMPSPYTVSLVNPEVSPGVDTGKGEDVAKEDAPEPVAPPVAPAKSKKDSAKEKEMVERKLDALKAKKKIEKIVNLRKAVIDLGSRGPKSVSKAKVSSSSPVSQGKGGGSADYYSTITKVIWQQWVYPDTGKKDIEAIISVNIKQDGTAIVQRVEKSSGDALFDRSAMRAIAKASPLPPPPQEMEIGVRFYP